VDASIELDGNPMLKAVEIDHPLVHAALTAEFCTQTPVSQQVPCRFFGFGLVAPQFADAPGWELHRRSIAARKEART
jgi:hypothetical protein